MVHSMLILLQRRLVGSFKNVPIRQFDNLALCQFTFIGDINSIVIVESRDDGQPATHNPQPATFSNQI